MDLFTMEKATIILHHAKLATTIVWYKFFFNFYKSFFTYLIFFIQKLTATINTGKRATIQACAASCTPGTFNGVTYTCCQSDNCNDDTTLATSNYAVSSCSVGGSFSLIDTASDTYAPTLCPPSSNSYCLVGFIDFKFVFSYLCRNNLCLQFLDFLSFNISIKYFCSLKNVANFPFLERKNERTNNFCAIFLRNNRDIVSCSKCPKS